MYTNELPCKILELTAARIGVDLDVFSQLSTHSKPIRTEELGEKLHNGVDAGLLARLLRYMASVGLVEEVGVDTWAASNYGNNLIGDGQRAGICYTYVFHDFQNYGGQLHTNMTYLPARFDMALPAYGALPTFLRRHNYCPPNTKSDTAFVQGHQVDEQLTFFDWLESHPENAGYFHTFMKAHRTGNRTFLDQPDIFNRINDVLQGQRIGINDDLERDEPVFVDVGGGWGQQCKVSICDGGHFFITQRYAKLITGIQRKVPRAKGEGHTRRLA